jgi:hypothetical protein
MVVGQTDGPRGTTLLSDLQAKPRLQISCHPPPRTEVFVIGHPGDQFQVSRPPAPQPYFRQSGLPAVVNKRPKQPVIHILDAGELIVA